MHLSALPHQLPHSILVGGENLSQYQLRNAWEGHEVQQLLLSARQRYGNAACCCRQAHLRLQIRLRDSKFHLAVWPHEGPSHDSECMFFRDELAEEVTANPEAVASAPATSLSTSHGPSRIHLALAGTGAPGAHQEAVSVRALAHRLWEAASLCRWHHTWTRDWGRTRYQLLQAAGVFTVNGTDAEAVLFVPRPYSKQRQSELNAEWDAFVRSVVTDHERRPRIIVAPLRKLALANGNRPAVAMLRHLHVPIGLTAPCADFLSRDCRNAISNSRVSERPQVGDDGAAPELIGFFSVEGSSRGGVWARSGWLMPVHPVCYIPAASRDVVMLVDELVAGRYTFQHLLSEQPPSRRATPDWLVRHVLGPDFRPVSRAAIEILNRGSTPEYRTARAQLAERMAGQGIPTWTWAPNGNRSERVVPALPPNDMTVLPAARERLDAIASSPQADYRFGPSHKFFIDERKTA